MEEIIKETETIKLVKNTKGYNWEIKILPTSKTLGDTDLNRLESLNKDIRRRFENVGETNTSRLKGDA